jgi:ketosteroid isomerase-like protein
MDPQDVHKLIHDVYAARRSGDVDKILSFFGDEPVFVMAGEPAASPVALSCESRTNLHATITQLVGAFEFLDQDIHTILVDGNRAAVHWRGRLRSTRTGEIAETELVDIVELRDGKIATFKQFCDTALAARLI